MTVIEKGRIIPFTLIDDRQHGDVGANLLAPLLDGKAVVLRVTDPKLMKKRRITDTFLFFHPIDESKMLVSLPGYGSELINTRAPIKSIILLRLGLNGVLSKALANQLTRLYERKYHA